MALKFLDLENARSLLVKCALHRAVDSVEIIQIVRSWRTVGCNLTMTKMASRPQIYADGVKEDGVLSHDIGREAEIITLLQATGE